ncbi:chalcone isomerase family protein [Melittangium boletus]|uniref:Chalcone isomerase domain-containing protein n=1 Tax=Melittangium boletus DSM 14713 TaxID=1294270 RepID=A0A250IHU2_9BACT|nr:chalcone isomerase family protein [Melittangium boletus]ATB30838.1 hypothetical protein MEBOL_004300 [Melittangium boletus DSM 14713]
MPQDSAQLRSMIPERQDKVGVGRRGARGLALALALLASGAEARALGGVRMPDTISLQGQELLLDHMEVKKRFFFDVYVWGLYLQQKPASVEEAISSEGAKQLQLRFKRGVNRAQLVAAFREFLSGSASLRDPKMKRLCEQLLQSLRGVDKGDSILISYIPNKGLLVSGEGSQGATIPGKAFADALFSAWLSANPIYQ